MNVKSTVTTQKGKEWQLESVQDVTQAQLSGGDRVNVKRTVTTPTALCSKAEIKLLNCKANNLRLEEEVRTLSSQCFSLKRFEGSHSNIQFHMGLPSHTVFMCVYRYLEPLLHVQCMSPTPMSQ